MPVVNPRACHSSALIYFFFLRNVGKYFYVFSSKPECGFFMWHHLTFKLATNSNPWRQSVGQPSRGQPHIYSWIWPLGHEISALVLSLKAVSKEYKFSFTWQPNSQSQSFIATIFSIIAPSFEKHFSQTHRISLI